LTAWIVKYDAVIAWLCIAMIAPTRFVLFGGVLNAVLSLCIARGKP
jgi:hypothetical protein